MVFVKGILEEVLKHSKRIIRIIVKRYRTAGPSAAAIVTRKVCNRACFEVVTLPAIHIFIRRETLCFEN